MKTAKELDGNLADMTVPASIGTAWRVRRMLRDGTARAIREQVGVSIGEAALAYGFSDVQLSRWERGVLVPQVRNAVRIGAMLDDFTKMARDAERRIARTAAS
jgi:helix-turn-helix protein